MSNLKILKAICEIRYAASASIFDNRGKIASKWQDRSNLSEWQIAHNQVKIHNKADTTYLQAGLRSAVVVMEMPKRYSDFYHQANEFLLYIIETLHITKIERIGIRLHFGDERKTFGSLVSKMRKALYGLDDSAWEILGGFPEDIGLPLTLKIGDNRANFSIGPMKQEQLTAYFSSNEIKGKLPKALIFVDFDLYQLEPKFTPNNRDKDLIKYIKESGETMFAMTNEFLDHYGRFQ